MSVNIPNQALPDAELLEGSRLPGLNWDDFRVFLAVVEIGSSHRAAEAVGLSQPTTSRRPEGAGGRASPPPANALARKSL